MDEQDEQLPSGTVYLSNRNEEDGRCLYRAAQPHEATLAVTQVPSFCHPWQVAAVANGTKFLFHPGGVPTVQFGQLGFGKVVDLRPTVNTGPCENP